MKNPYRNRLTTQMTKKISFDSPLAFALAGAMVVGLVLAGIATVMVIETALIWAVWNLCVVYLFNVPTINIAQAFVGGILLTIFRNIIPGR